MSDDETKYGVLDWRGEVLTPEQILEMAKTKEGYKEIGNWFVRARAAMGLSQVFERLDVFPTPAMQQECAHVMTQCLREVPNDSVMEWSRMVADWMNRQEDGGGHA